ncbi:MAG: hypothetical protein FJX23_09835 [Alphaproteobacteria bacterium]|nr:hypothetical protein [Alphaproteobacteria bacterium]
MRIPHLFLVSVFSAALIGSVAIPASVDAMPAPINKGVKKDENGNMVPNVDTRMGKDDAFGSDADFKDKDAVDNNTSGSFNTQTGVTNNTSGSFNTQTGVTNNTSGGINSDR